MDLHLTDKTALVTGSTAGIGLAIAKSLATEGASVYVNGRTHERVTTAIHQIRQHCPRAILFPFVADLSQAEEVRKVESQVQNIDILVNNLGYYEPKEFGDITDDDWLKMFNVNVMSGVRLSRYYLPKMLAQNWGRLIFISSESAIAIPGEMIHYGMSKTAQLAISRGLAQLTTGTNVTVNSILPGPTRSEGVEQFLANIAIQQNKTVAQIETEFFKNVRPNSLINRFISVDEVANLVTYIASPLAAATNGAALRVEGGLVNSVF
ncbi:SDR family NAD(P)-dependent oxidoreductase [Candidatus Paracaedibacter symbiosus]|uniref:SDR family NAD(P)-dependent oxidoreductase n=1 Tax=Candidatus Paracaedibacter symbiosus TaxID=244582 RepID=UPI000509BFEC|nr:SDR family oxidoreductase [Candidatus Paracaedibacter symbiosus]